MIIRSFKRREYMSYERSPRLVCSITTGIIHSSPFIHYNRHHLTSFIRLIREASSPSISFIKAIISHWSTKVNFYFPKDGLEMCLFGTKQAVPQHHPNLERYSRFHWGVHPRLQQKFRHLDELFEELPLLLVLQPSRQLNMACTTFL